MIKRKLLNLLKEHLNKKEISVLIGPRQSGKTTLIYMLMDYLKSKGETVLYFNLDIESDKTYFESQIGFLNKVRLEIGTNKGFVFIDEIQRKENGGLFLKGIYDMNLPYKFIITGSGSLELKEKIHESLVGRKRIFELSTVSFEEFLNYKTEYKYEKNFSEYLKVEKESIFQFLNEYLIFGGYPRVVIEEKASEKRLIIQEIFKSYIEKDISYLLRIRKTDSFINLVKVLASQVGKLTNLSEISSSLGISYPTLKEYLWYLEKTFVLRKLNPFFKNIKKEIGRMPIYYFNDLGLRNYAISNFNTVNFENGFVFQNFIFNILYNKLSYSASDLHFWRTKDKSEVDFVINWGKEIIPIEIKYSKMKKPNIPRGLRSFIKRFSPKRAYIVNLEFDYSINLNGTILRFIPYYMLFSELFWNNLL